jgi:hypothetical protein
MARRPAYSPWAPLKKMGRPFLAGNIEIAVCCELYGENFESKIGVWSTWIFVNWHFVDI